MNEQAFKSQTEYRATCSVRRNKNVIEQLIDGVWCNREEYKSVNSAKRTIRTMGRRSYTV